MRWSVVKTLVVFLVCCQEPLARATTEFSEARLRADLAGESVVPVRGGPLLLGPPLEFRDIEIISTKIEDDQVYVTVQISMFDPASRATINVNGDVLYGRNRKNGALWVFDRLVAYTIVNLEIQAQAKTAGDLNQVGSAMFSWLIDNFDVDNFNETVHFDAFPLATREGLLEKLVPRYLEALPERDGWGRPYEFILSGSPPTIGIRSAGRDGKFEAQTYSKLEFKPDDFDQDLVWWNGYFIRLPDRTGLWQ